MEEFSSVLRIHGCAKHQINLLKAFGAQACSSHKAGDPIGEDFSFIPEKTWQNDIILVTPQVRPESGISAQIDWICSKLEQNSDLLRPLIAEGGSIDISAWCFSAQCIKDFSLSANQMRVLAKYGAYFFLRFVVNKVFRK